MSVPIRYKRLRPGDDTDTYCGRCKAERAHQIVALNTDGTPVTVICRTCGNQHRFHQKKDPTATSTTRTGGRVKATNETLREAPIGRVRPYTPKGVYSAGEWIDHPKFGQGKVAHTRDGKIEVRFDSGPRLLVHAG